MSAPNAAMAAALLTALALAAGSAAQEELPAPAPAQDTVSPAEPTKDLFDLLRELRHKPAPPPPGPEDYKKWTVAAAPVLTYGPTSGFGIGLAGNMVTLRVGLQSLPGGPNYPGSVVLGMPASQVEVRITNSNYQKLAQ